MASAVTNFTDSTTGKIKFQCAVTCISDELSVFLGQQNIKFLADLCDWYDCPPSWKYDTKNMGTDQLDGVCFNLVAATAPDWLPSILPREAVGGGWTSRTVWIVEEDKGKTVVFPAYDLELEKLLIKDLERVCLLTGEFTFSDDGLKWYEEWYTKEDHDTQQGRPPIADPKMAGYCERRPTLLRKVSMIMSVSESDSLIIQPKHLVRALNYMTKAEEKMGRAFGSLGQARYAVATEKILGFLIKHKEVTRSQILNFFHRDVDLWTYKVVVQTLEKRGVVHVTIVSEKDEEVLKLNETCKVFF